MESEERGQEPGDQPAWPSRGSGIRFRAQLLGNLHKASALQVQLTRTEPDFEGMNSAGYTESTTHGQSLDSAPWKEIADVSTPPRRTSWVWPSSRFFLIQALRSFIRSVGTKA